MHSSSSSHKLAVVGSSHLVDSEPVYDTLDAHIVLNGKPEVVITGTCKTGVDLMVKKWCKRNNIQLLQYAPETEPDTGKLSPYAYQDRDNVILKLCTVVIAFPIYRSSVHTHQFINKAKSKQYYPNIRAVFTYTQEKINKKKQTKRARSCSPIREVDEKERTLKFKGSCITKRRKSPSPPPIENDDDEQPLPTIATATTESIEMVQE